MTSAFGGWHGSSVDDVGKCGRFEVLLPRLLASVMLSGVLFDRLEPVLLLVLIENWIPCLVDVEELVRLLSSIQHA